MTTSTPTKSSRTVAIGIVAVALVSIGAGGAMLRHVEASTNKTTLAQDPKPVTYVEAKAASYRPSRSYVGTLRPWVEANVGPQLVAAYVDTVLVRPGARVKRGDVLATLDCRNASTASSAIAMQARAIEARQKALADEAARTQKLLDGGFASSNEAEQAIAQSTSEAASLEAEKATLAHSTLEVGDCILRAPFDGEVGDRFADPGAFVRPGSAIVSVVDRGTVRFVADAPEVDFAVVAPDTHVKIHVDSTSQYIDGTIARRAPRASDETRTVHFEVDLENHDRSIPVDTTAEVAIEFGAATDVTSVPLYAATVRGGKAQVFVLEGDHAHLRTAAVVGETSHALLVDRSLAPGSQVVGDGRALLNDGDLVAGKPEAVVADVSGAHK
ncbi:MAG TPA: efflux RND transporter periplasmic adaptor subunit [Polyangiaceae bacterium]